MPRAEQPTSQVPTVIDINELKTHKIAELTRIAKALNIPDTSDLRKQELIFRIIEAQSALQMKGRYRKHRCAGSIARRLRISSLGGLQLSAFAR
jgi:Rho termination factor, N-terminal domain